MMALGLGLEKPFWAPVSARGDSNREFALDVDKAGPSHFGHRLGVALLGAY
jgi:hypothetical protein